ncbi:A-agglutinin anchorage subunit-like [Lycium barbarum]|uniref:A-agglutinin anchorage subunit-like n=1 Tax=Lycium barbarum TaxID=112863 RepID=UPI00293F3D6F|nr:A-agglutinin anchorage subunit-like [Lycium barbarum]
MATSSRRSSGPVLPIRSAFQRSISPTGRFSNSTDTSSFASSTSSSFYSSTSSTGFFNRSASPTRVNLHGFAPLAPTRVNLHIDRSISPRRSMTVSSRDQVVRRHNNNSMISPKRTCMCSPTTHPGSFRCSLHKSTTNSAPSISYSPSRLNARRSAMTNSLVRIGTVEGDLVKRALAALIRPSSHHLRRRCDFQPRPSRLSRMSKADDEDM